MFADRDKWLKSPHCGYNTIRTSLQKAWTHMPCMRNLDTLSLNPFQARFEAMLKVSKPFQLLPDPYRLIQSSSCGAAFREHYFLETSARADCLLVGDHVAASSLDTHQQYLKIDSFQLYSKSHGVLNDMFVLDINIGSCPSWRSLLIKDNFFELDFDGRGNVEIFKIEEIECLSHYQLHLHFKCSRYHHNSFFKGFDFFEKNKYQQHDKKITTDPQYTQPHLFRPFGCESLGRFHSSFQYLSEICRLFCHIIAKGLLERHDHVKCQDVDPQHLYDSPDFKYDCYDTFKVNEGCNLIYESVHNFLLEADTRRMRLLYLLPYGLQYRDDPTYISCLFFADQVQDTLFLIKETFKELFKKPPSPLSPPFKSPTTPPSPPNPLSVSFLPKEPCEKVKLNQHNQNNIDEFDDIISQRHNQRCMNRSICCYVEGDSVDHDIKVFESFKQFVDPFFVLHSSDSEAHPRDLRRLFSNLKRSIYSLELGHVCSFSTGF